MTEQKTLEKVLEPIQKYCKTPTEFTYMLGLFNDIKGSLDLLHTKYENEPMDGSFFVMGVTGKTGIMNFGNFLDNVKEASNDIMKVIVTQFIDFIHLREAAHHD